MVSAVANKSPQQLPSTVRSELGFRVRGRVWVVAHCSPSPEVVIPKEEVVEVVAPQPVPPESSMPEDDDGDDDGDDDDEADSNLVWG